MTALLCALIAPLQALANIPHPIVIALAAGAFALLLVAIPLARASVLAARRHGQDSLAFADAVPATMLGLAATDDPAPTPPAVPTVPLGPVLVVSRATAVEEKPVVICIHCGVDMAAHEDFCPACGYAQPMRQSFTA